MRESIIKKSLTTLFIILYICVGFVSVYHAIDFFSLSNESWLSIILACAFEIGQATVLFSLLTQKDKKIMPWLLMGVLTVVQILGNVFASYKYAIINNPDQLKYFTDSILFFIKSPNPQYNYVLISYIQGAILPIVALCMTGMIVNMMNKDEEVKEIIKEVPVEKIVEKEVIKEVPKEVIKEVIKKEPPKKEEEKIIL
jgi:hypothetical protein